VRAVTARNACASAAEGFACDASITSVVFGEVNPAVLDDLVRLCLQLAKHAPAPADAPDPDAPAEPAPDPGTPQALQVLLSAPAGLSREALERAIIGKAVALVSGPGGLASFLRREQLGARLAGPSLPLDVGYSDDVPAAIRNAVKLRDKFCQWVGGCDQPAAACEIHHTTPQASGGKTSIDDCGLFCSLVPPPRGDPHAGLDRSPEPRRHHHRHQPRQNQNPAQPRTTPPTRVTSPDAGWGQGLARSGRNASRRVWASSWGSATAGKWPPRGCSDQAVTVK